MRIRLLICACCLLLLSTLAIRASQSPAAQMIVPGFPIQPPTDCGGEPCEAVHRGARAFVDRNLEGLSANGRSCADCHMLDDNFQLSPANAAPLPPVLTTGGGIVDRPLTSAAERTALLGYLRKQ